MKMSGDTQPTLQTVPPGQCLTCVAFKLVKSSGNTLAPVSSQLKGHVTTEAPEKLFYVLMTLFFCFFQHELHIIYKVKHSWLFK